MVLSSRKSFAQCCSMIKNGGLHTSNAVVLNSVLAPSSQVLGEDEDSTGSLVEAKLP